LFGGAEEPDYFSVFVRERFRAIRGLYQSSVGGCTAHAYQKIANIMYSMGRTALRAFQMAPKMVWPAVRAIMMLRARTNRKAVPKMR
jgi:hypothetical protein